MNPTLHIKFLGKKKGTRRAERLLHECFRRWMIIPPSPGNTSPITSTEFFRPSKPLLEYIDNLPEKRLEE